MTGIDRDTTRIVRSWLEVGATQLPDHVLGAVLNQLPDHRQRRPLWPAWRSPNMSTTMRVVLAAVVVAAVVAGGYILLSRNNVGGPARSATPSPTAVSTASPLAHADEIPFEDVLLDPGVYSFYDRVGTSQEVRVTMTLPAGWASHESWYVHRDPVLSEGKSVAIAPWHNTVYTVYPDPCRRNTTVSTGVTVADLVEAFVGTTMHDGAAPRDITVSGYEGREIHIASDPTVDAASCVEQHLSPWSGRWVLPGTEQTLWILDVEGSMLVIDASAEPGADAAKRAEMQQVLQSIQIEVI